MSSSSATTTTGLLPPITLALVLLAASLPGGEGLKIRKLQVPTVVQNGTQSSVVLDCDYILEPEANGLVVKWFFNDHPNPVYQWIPNKRPQDLGVLKGKLNLDYKASEDESKVHRALQIINPTIELSGEYRCVVSTFDDEAAETKKMVIFVPERTMQLTQIKPREDQVTLRCTAEGVYPKPNMTISSSDRLDKGHVHVDTLPRNGVYDIVATMTLDDKDLMSPTTFDCVLRIPEANYTVRKSAVYYPDGSGGGSNWIEPVFTTTLLFAWLSVRL